MVRGAGYVANSTNAVKKTWKGIRELEFYLGRSPAWEIGELNLASVFILLSPVYS